MQAPHLAPAEPPRHQDWFVGLDGQPVGPVGHAFLQQQIDAGKVTGRTLVWREGMANWQALQDFEELRALLAAKKAPSVPEAKRSAPVALTRQKHSEPDPLNLGEDEPEPASAPGEAPSGAAAPRAPSEGGAAEPKVEQREPDLAALAGGASADRGVQKASGLESPAASESSGEAPGSRGEAVAKASESRGEAAARASEGASESATSDVAASGEAPAGVDVPPPPKISSSTPPSSRDLAAAGLSRRKKKGVHPMAWAFVAMAAAFGAVSAWFLFGQEDPKEQPVARSSAEAPQAQAPAADPAQPGPAPQPAADGEEADTEDPDAETTAAKGAGNAPRTGRLPGSENGHDGQSAEEDDGSGEPAPAPEPCDPDDPFCNPVSGPSASGPSDDGADGSGQGLTQSQLQRTVSRYRGSLTRRCRPLVTKGSAKVSATVRVAPSGGVQSVSTSGGDEVPGLAGCVASRIRNWRFPTSGGSSTFSVSFNFL